MITHIVVFLVGSVFGILVWELMTPGEKDCDREGCFARVGKEHAMCPRHRKTRSEDPSSYDGARIERPDDAPDGFSMR